MRLIRYTGQFRKDYKRMQKRGLEVRQLREVIQKLANEEKLEPRYNDHALLGKYAKARDCHIGPDWILIYTIVENELRLIRTGSHSDLFD
jgi:mRNA interferase YafQ